MSLDQLPPLSQEDRKRLQQWIAQENEGLSSFSVCVERFGGMVFGPDGPNADSNDPLLLHMRAAIESGEVQS